MTIFFKDKEIVKTYVNGQEIKGLNYETQNIEENNFEYWRDFAASSYAGGNGSSSRPYQITTPEELAKLVIDVDNDIDTSGKYYKLMNDIDLNGKVWLAIGSFVNAGTFASQQDQPFIIKPFKGNFNGNNKKIKNLLLRYPFCTWPIDENHWQIALLTEFEPDHSRITPKKSIGLFGFIENATLNNIIIESGSAFSLFHYELVTPNSYISDEEYMFDVGPICHTAINSTINNCTNNLNIYGACGGITMVAKNSSFFNCINNGTMNGGRNNGTVYENSFAGGIVQWGTDCIIENCVNNGYLINHENCAGIINNVTCFINPTIIKNCVNNGNIITHHGYHAFGGIAGEIWIESGSLEVSYCNNNGSINIAQSEGTSTADEVGGLIGYIDNDYTNWKNISIDINNCNNYGNIFTVGDPYCGGLIGDFEIYERTIFDYNNQSYNLYYPPRTFNIHLTNCNNYGNIYGPYYALLIGNFALKSESTLNILDLKFENCNNYGSLYLSDYYIDTGANTQDLFRFDLYDMSTILFPVENFIINCNNFSSSPIDIKNITYFSSYSFNFDEQYQNLFNIFPTNVVYDRLLISDNNGDIFASTLYFDNYCNLNATKIGG